MAHGKSLELRKIVSTKTKIIPSYAYNPQKKELSRRDKHRLGLQNKSPRKR